LDFPYLGIGKKLISLQRNRMRVFKQKAHTRQNALLPMRSAESRLSLKRRFVAFLLLAGI
jgi:hypothetical protein